MTNVSGDIMHKFIDIPNNHALLQYFAQVQHSVKDEPITEQTLTYGPYPYSFTDVLRSKDQVLVLGKKEGRNGLMRSLLRALTATGDNLTKMQAGHRVPFYFNVETLTSTYNGEPNITYDAMMHTFTILFGKDIVMQLLCSGQALILADNVDCFRDLDTANSFFDALGVLAMHFPGCGIVYGAEPSSYRGLLNRVADTHKFVPYFLT